MSNTESTPTSVDIPATPVTPGYEVSDIPTVNLPLTTATKAHLAGGIAAVAGAGQIATELLPDGVIRTYVQTGVAVLTVIAIWLGVYTVPNIPKLTRK